MEKVVDQFTSLVLFGNMLLGVLDYMGDKEHLEDSSEITVKLLKMTRNYTNVTTIPERWKW